MRRRVFDRYRSSSGGGKVLTLLAAVLVVFALSFLFSVGTFWLLSGGSDGEQPEPEQQPADPAETPPEASLEILRAQWNADRVEVEGRWDGDISSVRCDLFEGEDFAVVRWWDRAVQPTYDAPDQTFSQVFVAGEEAGEEPLDPTAAYQTVCQGAFAGDLSTGDEAPVEGRPPG